MTPQHFIFAMLSFLATICLTIVSPGRATSVSPPFPLAKGAYWIYQGPSKWTTSTNTVKQQTLTVKMEITALATRGDLTIAYVLGFPGDLAWYEEGQARGQYLLVQTADYRYYLLQGDAQTEARSRLATPQGQIEDLLTDSDLLLEYPLDKGKQYGDPDMISREDHYCCWYVESVGQAPITGVKGISPKSSYPFAKLEYRTNPDETLMTVVPGIGITAFTYEHHGTVAETHLTLVEYHPGTP